LLALLAICGAGMALPAAPDASELTSDDYYSWIFAVGGGGQIIKSSDAGKTWICSQCGDERLIKTDLNAVHFFTSRLGFVAGDGGVVLKTVNGGTNWQQSDTSVTANLYGIHIFQPLKVYAVGAGGLVISTDNGGDTWSASAPVKIERAGATLAPTLRSIRFTDSRNALMVGECDKWFVTDDGGESWSARGLKASNDKADGSDVVFQDSQNDTTALLYLSMDRFANMLAVGRKGLVYSISREVAQDSDMATFTWTKRATNPNTQAPLDIHGANSFNSSHFVVVGGGGTPAGYVGVSASPQQAELESSPISTDLIQAAGAGNLRLTSVYTPSIYTAVVAAASGEVYYTNDMTNTWKAATLPSGLESPSWLALSGRNAQDEASDAPARRPRIAVVVAAACLGMAARWVHL